MNQIQGALQLNELINFQNLRNKDEIVNSSEYVREH